MLEFIQWSRAVERKTPWMDGQSITELTETHTFILSLTPMEILVFNSTVLHVFGIVGD